MHFFSKIVLHLEREGRSGKWCWMDGISGRILPGGENSCMEKDICGDLSSLLDWISFVLVKSDYWLLFGELILSSWIVKERALLPLT